MVRSENYTRTPLPAEAKPQIGLMMLLWMLVILSPFVAFTVNGKVDDSDWTPALVTGGIALFAIAALSLRSRNAYRNLPSSLRAEYERGKLFPALAKDKRGLPRDFGPGIAGAVIQLNADGVGFSPTAWLRSDTKHRRGAMNALWHVVRGGHLNAPTQSLKWSDIREWEVHEDSEASDFYHLTLADGGYVRLRRPGDAKRECELLDLVRTAGQIPVRLFCDIDER